MPPTPDPIPDPTPHPTPVPLLDALSAEARRAVEARGVERKVSAGTVMWRAGTPARGLHILLAGRACVVRQRDGREVVVHRAAPGDTLGEVPVADGGVFPATLIAETPCRFLVLERPVLEELAVRHPEILWHLLRSLGARVREMAGRLESAAVASVDHRLAEFLLRRSGLPGSSGFTLGVTQADLARELGTVREVVARSLSRFVDEGVLERRGRARYRIVDAAALRRRASGA